MVWLRTVGTTGVLALAIGAGWTSAHADPPDRQAAALYQSGAFLEAAGAAAADGDADDLAFAARAVLAYCMTGEGDPPKEMIARAQTYAEQAMQRDPDHAEARLQLAIAVSLESRPMSAMDAWNSGLGKKGRELAEAVLKDDPDNIYANGFLAVWHVEGRRRAGAMGAGFIGASLQEAERRYEHAAGLAPDDVGVHWQYARALVALDSRRFGKKAAVILERAIAARADDQVELVMQARARELLSLLREDRREAETRALEML